MLWNSFIIPLIFSLLVGERYILFYKWILLLIFDSNKRYTVIDIFNMLVLGIEEKVNLYSLFGIIIKLLALVVLIQYLIFRNRRYRRIINATFINSIIVCLIGSYYVKYIWKKFLN